MPSRRRSRCAAPCPLRPASVPTLKLVPHSICSSAEHRSPLHRVHLCTKPQCCTEPLVVVAMRGEQTARTSHHAPHSCQTSPTSVGHTLPDNEQPCYHESRSAAAFIALEHPHTPYVYIGAYPSSTVTPSGASQLQLWAGQLLPCTCTGRIQGTDIAPHKSASSWYLTLQLSCTAPDSLACRAPEGVNPCLCLM